MLPKISVIIPIYNTAKVLDRCMISILHQTFTNIEIIAVDDGSEDKSGEIADNYAAQDKRIHVIHQENKGVSAARNIGIATAKGEYITFIDSDDYANPMLFETLYKTAQDNKLDVVSCSIYRVWDNQKVLIQSDDRIIDIDNDSYPDIIDQCVFGSYRYRPSACGKLYRRDIIINYNILFFGERMEDAIFNIKFLMVSHKLQILSSPLYYYHKRPGSATTSIVTDPQFPIRYVQLISELHKFGEKHQILSRIEEKLPQYYLQFLKSALSVIEQRKRYRYIYDVLNTLYLNDINFKVLLSRIHKKKAKTVREFFWNRYRIIFSKMCYNGNIAIAAFMLWRQLEH